MSHLIGRSYAELHPKKKKSNSKNNKQKKQNKQNKNGECELDEKIQGYDGEQSCPGGCGFGIQKTGGCNYIRCSVCKAEWCWLCHKLKGFSSDNSKCDDASHKSH